MGQKICCNSNTQDNFTFQEKVEHRSTIKFLTQKNQQNQQIKIQTPQNKEHVAQLQTKVWPQFVSSINSPGENSQIMKFQTKKYKSEMLSKIIEKANEDIKQADSQSSEEKKSSSQPQFISKVLSTIYHPTINSLFKSKTNEWCETLDKIKQLIHGTDPKLGLVGQGVWDHILDNQKLYYLNRNQKVQFLENLLLFIRGNFGLKLINKLIWYDTQRENKSLLKDQLRYCGYWGEFFFDFQSRIHLKNQNCLLYCDFIQPQSAEKKSKLKVHFPQLNFKLHSKQLETLTEQIRRFSERDLDSFAFVTLYLKLSLQNFFENNTNVEQLDDFYVKKLRELEQSYQANQAVIDPSHSIHQIKDFSTNQFFDKIAFKEEGKHYNELVSFILKKVQQGKKDFQNFNYLVQDTCLSKGYGFKSGFKIENQHSTSAIDRTIEKMLEEKFNPQFVEFKKKMLQTYKEQSIATSNQQRLKKFVQWQKQQIHKKIREIIQNQTQMLVDAKDLVRGKVTFGNLDDIKDFVDNIKHQIASKKYHLVELSNRFNKKPKDMKILIKIGESIVELQLAIKLDSVANQFNHKIYELSRSVTHSNIANLYINNEKWCATFFEEQLSILSYEIDHNPEFDANKYFDLMVQFEKKYLTSNIVDRIQSIHKNQKDLYNQQVSQLIKKIQKDIQEAKQKGPKDQYLIRVSQQQRQDQIKFYQQKKQFKKAEQIRSKSSHLKLEEKQIALNHIQQVGVEQAFNECKLVIEQYQQDNQIHSEQYEKQCLVIGQICQLFYRDYNEAIKYYKKILKVFEPQGAMKIIQAAQVHRQIGKCYTELTQYDDAIGQFQIGLNTYEFTLGIQHVDGNYPKILNLQGQVYLKKKNYEVALEKFQRALKIAQHVKGKQGRLLADIYINIGTIHLIKQDLTKAMDRFQKAVSIFQAIKDQSVEIEFRKCQLQYKIAQVFRINEQVQDASQGYLKALDFFTGQNPMKNQKEAIIQQGLIYYGMSQTYFVCGMLPKAQLLAMSALKRIKPLSTDQDLIMQMQIYCKLLKFQIALRGQTSVTLEDIQKQL